ncbi:MAG TPA: type IV secretion system protein [Gammaproteobacteria bacterium]|nr:type IV secretion system protein [Gammaproteobacteria bacterium]
METKNEFYQQSADWAYCMYQSQTVWLRRALFALTLIAALLTLSIAANLVLLPLKEKVPYLYAFDHATGEVTKVGELDKTTLPSNWEVTRYFLMQYVINHESYNGDNINYPYQMVWAQSGDEVQKQYDNEVSSTNPNSPYKLYGKDKYITTRVISINRLNENTVDIKFEKKLHDRASTSEQVTHKEAIIKWEYATAEITQKMLDRDPLGFKVIYYQATQVSLDNN